MTEDKVFLLNKGNPNHEKWSVFLALPLRGGRGGWGGVNHCLKVSGNRFQVQGDIFMFFEGGGPFQGGFPLLIHEN